jgi:hypothetical protein
MTYLIITALEEVKESFILEFYFGGHCKNRNVHFETRILV